MTAGRHRRVSSILQRARNLATRSAGGKGVPPVSARRLCANPRGRAREERGPPCGDPLYCGFTEGPAKQVNAAVAASSVRFCTPTLKGGPLDCQWFVHGRWVDGARRACGTAWDGLRGPGFRCSFCPRQPWDRRSSAATFSAPVGREGVGTRCWSRGSAPAVPFCPPASRQWPATVSSACPAGCLLPARLVSSPAGCGNSMAVRVITHNGGLVRSRAWSAVRSAAAPALATPAPPPPYIPEPAGPPAAGPIWGACSPG
jgi:hypothetical protein